MKKKSAAEKLQDIQDKAVAKSDTITEAKQQVKQQVGSALGRLRIGKRS